MFGIMIKELADKMTNVVMNYSEVEAKVREATSDDAWGPHGTLMYEIAQYTFTYEYYPEVMGMLWKRMFQENQKNWRRIYKSLLLLTYLIRNGSERVVTSTREHVFDIRRLLSYSCVDDNGKDQGINVAQKAKELVELLQDSERLREERKKARKAKDKYIGLAGDAVGSTADDWADLRKDGLPSTGKGKKRVSDSVNESENNQDECSISDEDKSKRDSSCCHDNHNNQDDLNSNDDNFNFADFSVFNSTQQQQQQHANGDFADFESISKADANGDRAAVTSCSEMTKERMMSDFDNNSVDSRNEHKQQQQSNVELLRELSVATQPTVYSPVGFISPVAVTGQMVPLNIAPNQPVMMPHYNIGPAMQIPNSFGKAASYRPNKLEKFPNTWQNPGVDISLDNLSPASQFQKPVGLPMSYSPQQRQQYVQQQHQQIVQQQQQQQQHLQQIQQHLLRDGSNWQNPGIVDASFDNLIHLPVGYALQHQQQIMQQQQQQHFQQFEQQFQQQLQQQQQQHDQQLLRGDGYTYGMKQNQFGSRLVQAGKEHLGSQVGQE